jgi:hypothetical protein
MNNDKQKRRIKFEIKFDTKARLDYLTGFSNRKKKRRTFGLAMQKVKDRKLKLEHRKEIRHAQLEKLEELEEQREIELDHLLMNPVEEEDQVSPSGKTGFGNPKNEVEQQLSEDVNVLRPLSSNSAQQSKEVTTTAVDSSIFGGQKVIVRTSYGLPEDSDEEADKNALASRGKKSKGVDVEQRHAGSVKRYIAALKGKPAKNLKKVGKKNVARKGKHGASNMVGIGGAANLKLARKTLARAETQLKNKGRTPLTKRKGTSRR